MPGKQAIRLMIASMLLLLASASCTSNEISTSPLTFPTERPEFTAPDKFELTGQFTTLQNQKISLDSNIKNYLFQNCEVSIIGEDIEISSSKFINSMVIVSRSHNVIFSQVIFKELNQYEKAALSINNSQNIVVERCQFINNYIGLGIHSSSAEVVANRFEGNNGHNALVIGEGSSVKVSANYLYGSFPHAILIMNREDSIKASVDIRNNFIDQTGEDAINFEDYRSAAPSGVSNNIITNSGWSAVVIEYNSWQANITVENNWIEGSGIDWELPLHPLQPDKFQPGWSHGILVEDSSHVQIRNNRILSAAENGIEIKNSREVVVQGNGIDCSQVGIGVHRYEEASLYREFSPLAQENASGSQVTASDNTIYQAQKDYETDEWSQLVTK
jgi:parallel beta-helix repeat protein